VQWDDKTPAAAGSDSAAPPVVAPPPTPTGTVVPYVVRDPSIGVGGPLVADLSALKVEVNKKDDPTSDTLRPLGTPDWNRWADPTFMRECNPMARP
jgi:hypothetical protein